LASLLVTIDVECDMPRWLVEPQTTLRNLEGLPRFQALCDRLGVRPTYLVTHPVATWPEGAFLRDIHDRGACEIGTHLHPWTCPPYEPHENRLEATHPSRLSAAHMEAKLATLTHAIEERFGRRPTSYRAGRFGLDGEGLKALARLGYVVDTSATPLCDWRGEGGRNWVDAPLTPYFPDADEPTRRGSSPVLEVPVSIAWDRPVPERLGRAIVKLPRRLRVRGLLDNPVVPLTKVQWLYPSIADVAGMMRLARVLVRRGVTFLNVFFHSSELWPGASPYCTTQADVDRYLSTLERFFEDALGELRATPRTLTEFALHHLEGGVS
jgi:hypothetical protein